MGKEKAGIARKISDYSRRIEKLEEDILERLTETERKLVEENNFIRGMLSGIEKSIEEERVRSIEMCLQGASSANDWLLMKVLIRKFIALSDVFYDALRDEYNELDKKGLEWIKPAIKGGATYKGLMDEAIRLIGDSGLKEGIEKKHGSLSVKGIDEVIGYLKEIEGFESNESAIKALIRNKLTIIMQMVKEERGIAEGITKDMKEETFTSKFKETIKRVLSLYDMLKKETAEENASIREIYSRMKLGEEDKKIRELMVLSKRNIEFNKNLSLISNIFITPKMKFPSGVFVSFPVNENELMSILKKKAIDSSIRANKEKLKAGSSSFETEFVSYFVNSCPNEIGGRAVRACFIFPIEEVINKKYFTYSEEDGLQTIKIYGKLPSPAKIIEEVKGTMGSFDELKKNINMKFKEWVEEASKLDNKFNVSWVEQATKEINRDFVKRWIKEEAGSFNEANKLSFNIVQFLVEERYAASLMDYLMNRKGKKPEFNERAYIEEMNRMSKDEFLSVIDKVKENFSRIISDLSMFSVKADTRQEIKKGIFVADAPGALPWEKIFSNEQADIMRYYHEAGSISEGVKEAEEGCRSNKKKRSLKPASFIRVFSYLTMQPLNRA